MSDLVNLHELKARLSHYTRLVKSGETVIVCERNVPIAELRPLQGQDLEPVQRPEPGLFKDQIGVGKEFFEADEVLIGDFFGTRE